MNEPMSNGSVRSPGKVADHGTRRRRVGYADRPIVKSAVWTWEVPVYFFVGGSAGMAGLIAGVVYLFADAQGQLQEALPVVSRALWIGFVGAMLSPPLLISDLGRPRRFLNMLRRFNRRSALSVGVWILVGFSMAVTMALWLHGAQQGWAHWPAAGAGPGSFLSPLLAVLAILGGLLATYTGVLIAATVVPAWNRYRSTLPVHFGLASLASASAWLVLLSAGANSSVDGASVKLLLTLMLVAALLDGALESWMRRGDLAFAGSAFLWARPLGIALVEMGLVVMLEWAVLSALLVLATGLAGRFHWVALGQRPTGES